MALRCLSQPPSAVVALLELPRKVVIILVRFGFRLRLAGRIRSPPFRGASPSIARLPPRPLTFDSQWQLDQTFGKIDALERQTQRPVNRAIVRAKHGQFRKPFIILPIQRCP